jgi:tetratricopeptide (TPR) repeat protein
MKMKVTTSIVAFSLGVLLIGNGSAAAQQKFEASTDGLQWAISQGRAKEFLTVMEADASDAERKERWAEASNAYHLASATAGHLGQLQKAILLGTKAVEFAERANDPRLQYLAMSFLAVAYANVGQPEKEREWIKKALEATKKISGRTEVIEGRLYGMLGQNYLRQGETKEAIEYILSALQSLESYLALNPAIGGRGTIRRSQKLNQATVRAESILFGNLNRLGSAYLQAGNPQEAIKAYERGMAIIQAGRVKNPADTRVVVG